MKNGGKLIKVGNSKFLSRKKCEERKVVLDQGQINVFY